MHAPQPSVSKIVENFLKACYKKMCSVCCILVFCHHRNYINSKVHKTERLQEGHIFSLIIPCYSFRWGGNIRQTDFWWWFGVFYLFFFFFLSRSNQICSLKGFWLNCLLTTFVIPISHIIRLWILVHEQEELKLYKLTDGIRRELYNQSRITLWLGRSSDVSCKFSFFTEK